MSLFDKLKDVAKQTLEEYKAKKAREKVLWDLTKSQLYELGADYDVPLTKTMSKEEMIEELSKCEKLTVKTIMKRAKRKKRTRTKTIRGKVSEDVEVEQEIIRTEKITTRVRKRKISRTEIKIKKELVGFKPIIRKKTKERDIEAQLVQRLQVKFGEDKINYQERARSGRIDIVVDDDYAIELKLLTSPSQLTPLLGQALNYASEYKKLFI